MSPFQLPSSPGSQEIASNFLAIGPNALGIDYFVGDIHGEGRLLACGLKAIGFDFERDRLIAVGDLVNRGCDHTALFSEVIPKVRNFYSVLGNHDIACVELIKDILDRGWTSPYDDAQWLRDVPVSDKQSLCNFLNRLPLAISLTLQDGRRVGVIHADFPAQFADFQSMRQVSTAEWPFCRTGTPLHSTLLGRERIQLLNDLLLHVPIRDPWMNPREANRTFEQPADVELMICGHSYSPGNRPIQRGKWLFLDTGAGSSPAELKGAALSIVEPLSQRVVQAFHKPSEMIGTREFSLDPDYQLPTA